jgi:hypothetical protein
MNDEFLKNGIILKKTWFGYKLYYKNGKKIQGYEWLYPSIDIFPMRMQDGVVQYHLEEAKKIFGKCYYDKKSLFPLIKYRFGEFELNGPHEPHKYLTRCYGSDWSTHAYQMFDHENERMFDNKEKIRLNPDHYIAAMPTRLPENVLKL